mmetsp:Transcript_27258/g.78583  ORF Transcript_27258/g.78583 Transcript_27258/m.78583 type:complete len:239 (+) Transcript_27258:230-946(+)
MVRQVRARAEWPRAWAMAVPPPTPTASSPPPPDGPRLPRPSPKAMPRHRHRRRHRRRHRCLTRPVLLEEKRPSLPLPLPTPSLSLLASSRRTVLVGSAVPRIPRRVRQPRRKRRRRRIAPKLLSVRPVLVEPLPALEEELPGRLWTGPPPSLNRRRNRSRSSHQSVIARYPPRSAPRRGGLSRGRRLPLPKAVPVSQSMASLTPTAPLLLILILLHPPPRAAPRLRQKRLPRKSVGTL